MDNRTVTDKSQCLYEKAKAIIPGGTQLLSKRPERFAPGVWPAYFAEAKGCEIRDIDGNRYYDMSTTVSVPACWAMPIRRYQKRSSDGSGTGLCVR